MADPIFTPKRFSIALAKVRHLRSHVDSKFEFYKKLFESTNIKYKNQLDELSRKQSKAGVTTDSKFEFYKKLFNSTNLEYKKQLDELSRKQSKASSTTNSKFEFYKKLFRSKSLEYKKQFDELTRKQFNLSSSTDSKFEFYKKLFRTASLEYKKQLDELSRKQFNLRSTTDSKFEFYKKQVESVKVACKTQFDELIRRHSTDLTLIKRLTKQYKFNGCTRKKIYPTVGGSATEEITMYGLNTDQVCHVSMRTVNPTVTVKSSRCEENKLVIEFSADPGASHLVNITIN